MNFENDEIRIQGKHHTLRKFYGCVRSQATALLIYTCDGTCAYGRTRLMDKPGNY